MEKINEKLEEFAHKFLIDNDMLKLPVNIVELTKNLGIEILQSPMENGISGAIKLDEKDGKFKILVNSKESMNRKRFTIAHELSHYLLHRDKLETDEMHIDTFLMFRDSTRKINAPEEKEADYLAGALLMDKNFIEMLYNDDYPISLLSQIFQVSESAVTVRLMVLGLLK